jgi:hypothetical protein
MFKVSVEPDVAIRVVLPSRVLVAAINPGGGESIPLRPDPLCLFVVLPKASC